MEKKDNKVVEKVDDLYGDLSIEEQSKDLCDDFRIIEGNIGFILDPDLDIDRLGKSPIAFKPSNLGVKIFENVFYIVTKNSIYIYSKDF